MTTIYDGMIIERSGRAYRIDIKADEDGEAPWEACDGHGIVTDWTRRDKTPGELVLCEDRGHKRYYDFAASVRLARKEGWGLNEKSIQSLADNLGRAPTKREIVAEAVRRDYEYLRGWCNDEWHYVGVVVTDVTDDGEDAPCDYGHALWGIESSDNDYMTEVVNDLIGELTRERGVNNRFHDAMNCGI